MCGDAGVCGVNGGRDGSWQNWHWCNGHKFYNKIKKMFGFH